MEVLANITPLTITINELSIRTYLRIKTHLPNWDDLGRGNLRGHLFQIKKWVLGFNLDLDNMDRIPPTFQPQHSLVTSLSDFGSSQPPPPNSPFFSTLTVPKLRMVLVLDLQSIRWTQTNAPLT